MKAILEFNLPEEQDEFNYACNGLKYCSALSNIDSFLRSKIKYDETLTDEQYKVYEDVRTKLWEILNDDNITIY